MSVAQLQTDIAAIRTAIDSSDYSTARKAYAKALATLAGLPDSESSDRKVTFQRNLDRLGALIDQLQGEAGVSIQRIPEYRKRPGEVTG